MLEFLKNPESIRKAIMKEKKIGERELSEKVSKRQEEFNGLISESAALYSIAKELGVEVQSEKGELQFTPVKNLSPGMHDVNLHVRIMKVLSPRKFEKNGKGGKVCNMSIADESGESILVLWNRDVELIEKGVIGKGDTVDVLGANVKDSGEVHLSMGGEVLKVKQRGKLPEIASARKIWEMEEGIGSVDFVAEVLEVGAVNSFEKNGRKKQVSTLLISDGSDRARLTLWEGNAELAERVKVGDVVKVEDGYVKKGVFGKELHADWRSRVMVNPKNVTMPEIKTEKAARVSISELKDGMLAEVEGSVVKAEVHSDEEGKLVVDALLSDESSELNCLFLGNSAKDFLGVKTIPHDVDAATVLELKRHELVGRKIVVKGNARKNKSTGKMELVVDRMI
jgi:ssDNA-binding replication factor A large subunit